jgi:hypothetical protein
VLTGLSVLNTKLETVLSEMRKHRPQQINLQHDSVIRVSGREKLRQANFNSLFLPAKFRSDSSNKAKKIVENIYTYLMMFLENSSIHGLKYLTPQNRAVSER